MGDFNADIEKTQNGRLSHLFGKELSRFCVDEDYILADHIHLSGCNTFTYKGTCLHDTSWLDHLLCTRSAYSLIHSINIDYNMITSDHLPICTVVNLPTGCYHAGCSEDSRASMTKIHWDDVTDDQRLVYRSITAKCLADIEFDHELALCDNVNCSNLKHLNSIDFIGNSICTAMQDASVDLKSSFKLKFKPIAGWNDYCKDLHCESREAFLQWKANNKPRYGPLYDIMRRKHANFKYAFRKCRNDLDRKRCDNLADKLSVKIPKNSGKRLRKVIILR